MFSRPKSYWKFILYVVLTLVCFVLQSVPAFGVRFLGCAPSLLLLLAVGIAFFETPAFSAWFGLIAGLLSQLTTASLVGTDAILFMFAGYILAILVELIFQRKFIVYLFTALGLTLLQQLLDYLYHLLLWDGLSFGSALVHQILPTFFFTGLFAFPLYWILWHYDCKFRAKEELE
ncbi:MAG: rod shape-determining protein MreD [Clostridia bacterium]|nr:rod shape-determining protein MreD [Clostridia bacterium]